MAYKHDWLFQRPGSRNWHIRLLSPDGRIERSLGTPDKIQAEMIALPLIAEHKRKLLASRPRFTTSWRHDFAPGLHDTPEGRVMATDKEVHYLDADGKIVRTTPNGGPQYSFPVARNAEPSFEAFDTALAEHQARSPLASKNGDDALIDTYLKHSGVAECSAWAIFKSLCPNVKLADATRADGRKLVAHWQAEGLRSATIRRKLVPLRAAVNLAIDEGRLKFNPFANIVPKADDSEQRKPFNDDDMMVIRQALDKLAPSDKLMVTLLATTGCRLGECFHIKRELNEAGIRYVEVGSKTEASQRRLPFPAEVLPLLPDKITGPLFAGNARSASVRLGRWLRAAGIEDAAKVLHSFRHRAADRLRAVGCPRDIRLALLGHETKSIADDYGEGFPVTVLREWIDRIGF